jgi:deoxyribonuclease-4
MKFGAHVSIRGALHLAVDRAVAIGCECLQIFVGSPRQWRAVVYPERDLDFFIEKRQNAKLDPLVAHAAYLINLAAADPDVYRRSTAALIYALRTLDRLGGFAAITHLGSRGDRPWPDALARVTASLTVALDATDHAMVLLEHSVGAGGQVGGTFSELRDILEAMRFHPRVGICLDSCHVFAAGWDIRTERGVHEMLRAFDGSVGLDHLRALHLNDSKGPLGSRIDRHENIGRGRIGRRGFAALVNHPQLRRLAGFIETPGFDHQGPDRKNLLVLKQLRELGRRQGHRVHARGT